jgi:membrane fusion protein (multidrug efflux system)
MTIWTSTMRMLVFAASTVVLLALAVAPPVAAQQAGPNPVPPVVVAPARIVDFVDRVEALGTTRADETVRITTNVTEKVLEIHFDDGQTVAAGDILVVLNKAEEEADLKAAEAILTARKLALDRSRQLEKRQFAPTAQLDERAASVRETEAQIESIKSRIADRVIRAPFGGVVGLRNISVGILIEPGDLITTLDDLDVIKVDFSVPSSYLSTLVPGLPIVARTAAFDNRAFAGEVKSVGTQVDPVTRSVVARAILPNPDGILKPGLLVTVELLKNQRRALVIPEEALIPRGRKNAVLVIDEAAGNKVVNREVEIGARRPGEVEIVAGLSEGEKVVTHGTLSVRPGQQVTIKAVETADRPSQGMGKPGEGS